MKTLQEIIDIIKNEGEEGCTKTERYIDVYDPIMVNDMSLAQLVYLGDEDVLEAYFLDNNDEGWFVDWDDLDNETQKEIENLSIWD